MGGRDELTFRVPRAPAKEGPYRVEASLHYQVLGARYAAEILAHETEEMRSFRKLYNSADARPELLAETSVTLP